MHRGKGVTSTPAGPHLFWGVEERASWRKRLHFNAHLAQLPRSIENRVSIQFLLAFNWNGPVSPGGGGVRARALAAERWLAAREARGRVTGPPGASARGSAGLWAEVLGKAPLSSPVSTSRSSLGWRSDRLPHKALLFKQTPANALRNWRRIAGPRTRFLPSRGRNSAGECLSDLSRVLRLRLHSGKLSGRRPGAGRHLADSEIVRPGREPVFRSTIFKRKQIVEMTVFMGNTRRLSTNVYTKTPDGGWGWITAIAFFFTEVLTYGIIKSFGVFFYDIMIYFNESNSKVSWILSISMFVMMFTAPLSTILSNHFGYRPVVMLGGLLVSLGMMAASFARTIVEMYITIGLVSAFTLLKNELGWKNCLLIIGALQLNIIVCGALLRPIVIRKPEEKPRDLVMETKYMLENEETRISIDSVDSGVESLSTSCDHLEHSKKCLTNDIQKENLVLPSKKQKPQPQPKLLDFSILKNKSFVFYALFGLFCTLGFFAPQLYVIPLSISLGVGEWAAYMLSAMAIMEVFGRLSVGWVLNKQPIRKIYIEQICVSLLSLVLLCFPFVKGFGGLVTCSMLCGFLFGTVASTHIPMLAEDDVVGVEKMSSAVGIYVFIQSFSGLGGPSIGGWLVDITGQNYGSAFFFCGIGTSLGAFFLALVRPSKKWLCQRKESLETAKQEEFKQNLNTIQDVPEDFLETDLKKSECLHDQSFA
ncbi:monocarboxylate transporter 7-like isoform X2 [Narcine bancroftii]|uniref:monocarboxylate transporter 7-like isoform X2 n=1 Tax=Narcine bancroftii TaxID=1343680 RepID=UPI0038310CAF